MRSPRFLAAVAAALLLVPAVAVAEVVINEVDYDQPGTDAAEYFELKNNGPGSVDLSEYTVELVNGSGGGAAVYQTVGTMTGILAAGDYYVVCNNNISTPNCDLVVAPATNMIQNGAPDAIGLKHLGVVVDAVSYEGNTGAPYTEGTGAVTDDGSVVGRGLSRVPDGTDTDDNSADFAPRGNSPGAANNEFLPVAGPIALAAGGALLALGGGWAIRRRRQD